MKKSLEIAPLISKEKIIVLSDLFSINTFIRGLLPEMLLKDQFKSAFFGSDVEFYCLLSQFFRSPCLKMLPTCMFLNEDCS